MPTINDPQKGVLYGRLAYAHVFKPTINKKVAEAKPSFSLSLIMDPSTEEGKESIAKCKKMIAAAGNDKWKKWPHLKLVDDKGKPHDPKRFCLVSGETYRDNDGNVRPEFKGMMVLKAKSTEDKPPVVVDSNGRTPLTAKDGKCYSGSWAKVGVRVYGTENGGLGVFAALDAVQFKKHDEPLGGGAPARAEDYFDEEEPGLSSDEADNDDGL